MTRVRAEWDHGQGSAWDQGQGSECEQGQGSEWDQAQGSEWDQAQDSQWDQGQGSEWDRAQGSQWDQGRWAGDRLACLQKLGEVSEGSVQPPHHCSSQRARRVDQSTSSFAKAGSF